MRRILALLAVVLLTGPFGQAQDKPAEATFPESWVGSWKGPCRIAREGKTAMEFPMELHVARTDAAGTFAWRIVYGKGDRRQERPYELVTVDAAKGHYRIDEKNSIVLESFLEDDCLHSRFWVADNVIEATYARDGDTLQVTMTTFGAKPATMTGGKGRVPVVASYGLTSVQRGTLARR